MVARLEDDDPGVLRQTAKTGRRGHACRDASDDDDLHAFLLGVEKHYTPGGILILNPIRRITMCRAVTCKKCGKTTWAGCGQHVDQVLRGVPRADRCEGHAAEAKAPAQGSFLSRLFKR
ncbi:hypothetical protein GCM10010488_21130 [Oerskovia jenensis]